MDNRTFASPLSFLTAGDLGPEGLIVIKEEDSPGGEPMLAVANEVSGSVTLYEIQMRPVTPTPRREAGRGTRTYRH